MKAKWTLITLAVVLSMLSFAVVDANAGTWKTCEVIQAGPSGKSAVIIMLTHAADSPAFKNRKFRAYSVTKKEMLAVALTAMATGKNVYVYLTSVKAGSTVTTMLLKK